MDDEAIERLMTQARSSPGLAKLQAMARNMADVVLRVLLRNAEQVLELSPTGDQAPLPEFCRIMRSTPEGTKRCITCRTLLAFGACCSGLIEYACHGGVSVIAAPGVGADGRASDSVVVNSCAFVHGDLEEGWEAARAYARGLPIDFDELRQAYYRLPRLSDAKLSLAKTVVDIAACVVGEIERHAAGQPQPTQATLTGGPQAHPLPQMEGELKSALVLPRNGSQGRVRRPTGSGLVQLVTTMVSRNPAIPYTVCEIARAAHVTPNHFSMLFRRHTGRTFTEFLAEKRLGLAEELLRDLTLNIGQVARRAGFGDAGYFARRFKQRTGLTPRQWRETL